MKELIDWFQQVLDVSIRLYFRQECEVTSLFEVQPPVNSWWREITGKPSSQITFEEKVVIMLALMLIVILRLWTFSL